MGSSSDFWGISRTDIKFSEGPCLSRLSQWSFHPPPTSRNSSANTTKLPVGIRKWQTTHFRLSNFYAPTVLSFSLTFSTVSRSSVGDGSLPWSKRTRPGRSGSSNSFSKSAIRSWHWDNWKKVKNKCLICLVYFFFFFDKNAIILSFSEFYLDSVTNIYAAMTNTLTVRILNSALV